MSSSFIHKLTEDQIQPDVIKSIPKDIGLATVVFKTVGQIAPGSEVTPHQAREQPSVLWIAENNQFYTVILTDPDVPSRNAQNRSQVKHWLVVNIPGNHLEKGHVESEYFGPGPEKGSGLHRYTFLVYKQKAKLPESQTIPFCELKGRFLFDAQSFAEENGLEGPVATNFFQAQYDDSVPSVLSNFKRFPVVFKNICPLLTYKSSRLYK